MILVCFSVLLVVGALIGGGLLRALLPILKDSPVLMRANYRGESVPLAGGIPIAMTLLIGFGVIRFVKTEGITNPSWPVCAQAV